MKTSAVIPFYFQTQEIRTILDEKQNPWFVAKDVCDVLEIEWKGSGTLGALEEDKKGTASINTLGGRQDLLIVSESGLYVLIFRSNKTPAKTFRKWVTAEVLPAIRKTGTYDIKSNLRTVDVFHNHHRATNSPGGLDIRYTLDLTKVILSPTRRSLALLERLTGITVTDLDASVQGEMENLDTHLPLSPPGVPDRRSGQPGR